MLSELLIINKWGEVECIGKDKRVLIDMGWVVIG